MRKFIFLAVLVVAVYAIPRPDDDDNDKSSEEDDDDICSLPPTTGPFQCTAFIEKWTYNKTAGACVRYVYGGCRGTANLFPTELACLQKCNNKALLRGGRTVLPPACSQPAVGGPCRGFKKRFFFNVEKGVCETFNYGGCKGNDNNFETLEQCQNTCTAGLKPVTGVITLPAPVEGKSNLQPATSEAVATGSAASAADRSICSLPPIKMEGGISCLAFIPSWTFNSAAGKCERYIYGGCGKTENLFPTEEACVARCGAAAARAAVTPVSRDVCLLPKELGPCYALIPAFVFVKEKNRCEKFTYGGCGGNANNFATAEECYKSCGGDTPSTNAECEHVQCDLSLFQYYADRGCRPQYQPGACCPIRYVCPRGEVASVPSCSYRGVRYAVGERIPQITEDIPCKAGCYCQGDGNSTQIVCANVECFHPNQFNRDCTRLYDHSSCCPTKYICPGDEGAAEAFIGGCPHQNTTYYKGEHMPSDDPCKNCICLEGPDGSAQPVCKDVQCIIELPAPDCVPIYVKDSCCPVDYTCPKSAKRVIQPQQEAGTVPVATLPAPVEESSATARISPVIRPIQEPRTVPIATLPAAVDRAPASGAVNLPALIPGGRKGFQVKNKRCLLPKEVGPCRGFKPSFYYDVDQQQCLQFNYGGCKGNENRFETSEECLNVCKGEQPKETQEPTARVAAPVNDICNQPRKVGPCRASKPRFYFDTESETCKQFAYGGCDGNDNNFLTEEECLQVCKSKPASAEPGLARSAALPAVPVETPQPASVDVCSLPKEVGPCRAHKPRFYFNAATGTCDSFSFGGCKGNANNFLTQQECLAKCKPQTAETSPAASSRKLGEVCDLSPDGGPCRGFKKRYFFNAAIGECQQFNYGGCRGNANNFLTLEDCREGCVSKPTEEAAVTSRARTGADLPAANPDCKLPADSGFCRGSVTRFYFDDADKSCKPFTFGGCFGNGNNFMTETECLASCAPEQPRATVRAQFGGAATLDLPVAPAPDECVFGNLTLKIGDAIETEDPCVQCTCHTPPEVSCTRQTCPPFPVMPDANCHAIVEPGQCCPSYGCVPNYAPFIDLCADHICPEGTVCKVQSNETGPYADCVAEEPGSSNAGAADNYV